MPSASHNQWTTTRAAALDEIAGAHAAVGGTKRGRRYATQQINRAYTMLLASQFQGFCRDLHSESVEHVVSVLSPPLTLLNLVRAEFTRERKLDRGNAQPNSLKVDFRRLGIDLWPAIHSFDPGSIAWRRELERLNEWRNAIAHANFTSPKLGGIMKVGLAEVRRWRAACERIANAMDEVVRRHLLGLTGKTPW